jgi:type I restriction enzyme S subunit
LLRIGNVQDRHLRLDDLLFVSERKAQQLSKYRITPNDLLFARQGATTGRNALASQKVDGALINYHIIRVSLEPTKCNPRFVESMFNSWLITHQIERSKGRGTREGVNTQQITSLRFPGPEVAEQNRITTTRSEAMAAIEAMKAEIIKLGVQKAGLMQDLLTGKVSVAPLLERAVA